MPSCRPITGIGLDQPGRYAAFVLKPIHNFRSLPGQSLPAGASRRGPRDRAPDGASRQGLDGAPPGGVRDRASRRGVPAGAASGMAAPRSGRRPRLEREKRPGIRASVGENPNDCRRLLAGLTSGIGIPGRFGWDTVAHASRILPSCASSSVRPMKISSNIGRQPAARFAGSGTTSNAWKTWS